MTRALPRTGVTLYSFTPDFHAGRVTLDDLLAKAAELDMGPGLEVIGFQSIRGFPNVTPEFERHFKGLVDRYGFEPSCLDCNADRAVRSDRLLTEDELYDYLAAQLRAAHQLGFPTARMQWTAPLSVTERLVPLAEQLDVRMGVEIHAPETPSSPWVMAQREWHAKHQSPYLGFVIDFGSTATQISPSMFEVYRSKGLSDELLQAIADRWHELDGRQFEAHDEIGAFVQLAVSMGAPPDQAINLAVFAVGIHGHGEPRQWLEIADQIVHVHAKFFHVTEDGVEPAVPVADTIRVLIEAGYTGYISSEYEGWHWDTTTNAFEMVQREQRLIRGVLEEAATAAA
jgi:sugar phosphate isomerase/epimerase